MSEDKKTTTEEKNAVKSTDKESGSKPAETKKVETKKPVKAEVKTDSEPTAKPAAKSSSPYNSRGGDNRNNRRGNNNNRKGSKKRSRRNKNPDGLDKRIVDIRRVTRVYKGGKRMRLSVLLVVGDKKGNVGVGLAKGADVRSAEEKAYNKAKKNLVTISLKGTTIPHEISHKMKAAKIYMKPAAPGTGVIAGGALRAVLELVGVKDILTKVNGTNNNITNVYAAIEALQELKSAKTTNVK